LLDYAMIEITRLKREQEMSGRFKKAGFIGGGNIAEAMIRGFITSGLFDPGDISVSDVDKVRLEKLNSSLGVAPVESNSENAASADILFLCVKPSLVLEIAAELTGKNPGRRASKIVGEHAPPREDERSCESALRKDTFVVSVAAGKSLQSIQKLLGDHKNLVRIMPNLAASVRKSTIGLYAESALTKDDLAPLMLLLSNLGKVYRVDDEHMMAVITALSGSAPAYYVMLADALIEFGISQGLGKEFATQMILSTMEGSAEWALRSKIPLSLLWKKVVTPGGTTQAGIDVYEAKGLIEIFVEGLEKATERARELGDR
jgi:pyrroline-5-carboxylate reductase